MPEENIISISSVMDQAQVFASAWSLVGGPFDNGDALEHADEAKEELREMLEVFFSNTELKNVADVLVQWHQDKLAYFEKILGAPADMEVRLGEDDAIVLTGEMLKGFRIGLVVAQGWISKFPLQVARQPGEEDDDE
ncbi:host nuclease inhibitor protein [Pseudomonas nitroreducens]|uniref:hypothetical protein n=1 Tax=Pseudomonas nitroreducens TaxID=46680 RepID=UPI0002E2AEDA|nr:hypothetical protein [Pseudomonas nitroreducens]